MKTKRIIALYFHKTPRLLTGLYPGLTWNKDRKERSIYLTFDDGPCPDVTEFVIDQLHLFDARATFFCVGDNIGKHPVVFEKLVNHGHVVANHTFNHLDGWKQKDDTYITNIQMCESYLRKLGPAVESGKKPMFRPPYGKIKRSQIRKLKNQFDIIMWDVLSGDFDPNLSPQDCLSSTLQITKAGSIVIFHDSVKAEKNMRFALPKFLEYFTKQGYTFKSL